MNKLDYLNEFKSVDDINLYINQLREDRNDDVSLFLSSIYESGNRVEVSYKEALSYLNSSSLKKERLLFLLRHLNESFEEGGELFSLKEIDSLLISSDPSIVEIKEFYNEFNRCYNSNLSSSNEKVNVLISSLKECNSDSDKFYNDFTLLLDNLNNDLYSFYFIGKLLLLYIPLYSNKNNSNMQILFFKKILKERPDLKHGEILNALGLCYINLIFNDEITNEEEYKEKSEKYASLSKEYFTEASTFYNLSDANENLIAFTDLFNSILNKKQIEKAKKVNKIIQMVSCILVVVIMISLVITIIVVKK